MKRLFILLCSSVKCCLLAQSATPDFLTTNKVEITPALVNQLAEEARTNHPSLRAADARVASAQANEQSIRAWDDPMAMMGVMGANKMMRMDDGDLIYGFEQKLPLFGKPQAAKRVAQAETKVTETAADMRFQELKKDFAKALFMTALAEREFEIGREDLHWLDATIAVMEKRYEVGDATQLDILRLQNERAKRDSELKTASQLIEHDRVNLNALLNRDLGSPWPRLILPQVANEIFYSANLLRLALENEPKLQMLREEVNVAEAMKRETRRQRYPDITLGTEIRNYTGSGEFRQGMVSLSFNIPWGNRKKYDADLKRETEKKKAAEFEVADVELSVRREVHDLVIKIEAARRESVLYRDDILPRSETALESARLAWESNRGMFRDVLEARRMLLDARVMYAKAIAEQYEMMAELVLCCGLGDLEALQMIGAIPDGQNPEQK